MSERPRWRLGPWLPIPFYLVAVLAFSAFAVPATPWNMSDKLAHVIEFAGLGALVTRALILQFPRENLLTLSALAALFATGCGALDEWVQSYAPLRTSDLADLAADAIGGAIGALACAFIVARVRARKRSKDAPALASSPE